MAPRPVRTLPADLSRPEHQEAVLHLLDHYMQHPMGAGRPLDPGQRQPLLEALQQFPGCLVVLALDADRAVGMAICFLGFSTFHVRPLLNIHDLVVHEDCRGQGVGRQLLAEVQRQADARGCCKLTLEVRADNAPARHLYQRFGFDGGIPGSTAMEFWTKQLRDSP